MVKSYLVKKCHSDGGTCVSKFYVWSIYCTNTSTLVVGGVYQMIASSSTVDADLL